MMAEYYDPDTDTWHTMPLAGLIEPHGCDRLTPHIQPVTQASITAALAEGLEMLLLDWRQALADRDDDLLDWLAPRIVARAHLTCSHARQAAEI